MMKQSTLINNNRKPAIPDLRTELLQRRYLMKDSDGQVIETPRQMFQRVAAAVAAAEAHYGLSPSQISALALKFRRMMARSDFLPNSPTLMNAGRQNGLLSACFVLPIKDSVEGIFDAVKCTALIQKAGGGTGFAFDTLRPTGDNVSSSGGVTSGPISFWRVFAQTTEAIQQGAHRRGANMGMMSIDHPDILKFIHAKRHLSAFCNFNISVKVSDVFMARLKEAPDTPHVVINPRTGLRYVISRSVNIEGYGLQDLFPENECDAQTFSRREVWDLIVANAHATGEPGLCFIDRINETNPTPAAGPINATNPCGEQPLLPYEACNLGSINIAKFVCPRRQQVDWDRLSKVICLAVRFLDNVIDVNHYPVPQIRAQTLGNRKIGLGVMGFADALILMGLRYDSQLAVRFAWQLSRFLQKHAHAASRQLAESQGSFPNWAGSTWDTQHRTPMRNATCTTVAPTGTISIIAGCSSGIEPLFSLAYKRVALEGREFVQVHPLLERLGSRNGWMSDSVRQALLDGRTTKTIPSELAELLVTAHQIAPEWHVRVQAAFQEHTDNAVSKTVNLPSAATVEDVDKVFRMAFRSGCKGTTVYRDGSRIGQTLSKTSVDQQPTPENQTKPRTRTRVTLGKTTKFRMGCGTLFVTVNCDEQGLCEVFANLGKAGGCPSQSEATCRVISAALRSGVAPKELIEQLCRIRCLSTAAARNKANNVDVQSCPDAIAKAMREALGESEASSAPAGRATGRACPFCQHEMRREAGCFVCDQCLHNSCG